MSSTTSENLFILAKKGDKTAFETLYTTFFTPVFRYVYLRIRNKELAEDLCQTIFLKALEKISDHRSSNTSPIAYFLTVARNTLIDYWRKKKDIPFEPENLPERLSSAPDAFELAAHNESVAALYEAMRDLNNEQQEILILRFINNQSNDEIAAIIGKSNDAVRQIQSRAIKQLRVKLTETI